MVGYVAGVDPHCSGRCLRHVTGGELFLGQLHNYCLIRAIGALSQRQWLRQGVHGGASEPITAMSSNTYILSFSNAKTRILAFRRDQAFQTGKLISGTMMASCGTHSDFPNPSLLFHR